MKWTNYHNRSKYDDGKDSIENHVIGAISQGVKCLGFSGHCPIPIENNWCMKHEDINHYIRDIEQAKEKYRDQVEIYKSLEVDYIPGLVGPADSWIKDLKLDYIVGSIHFAGFYENGDAGEIDSTYSKFLHCLKHIYMNDVKALVKEYFHLSRQLIKETSPDILGHMDKIKMHNKMLWHEQASWYQEEVLATLEEAKANDTIIEVNTRGIYKKITNEPYPSPWILNHIRQMGIPIQLNSDGHLPREITQEFYHVAELLQSIGFREFKILKNHEWRLVKFSKNGLQW